MKKPPVFVVRWRARKETDLQLNAQQLGSLIGTSQAQLYKTGNKLRVYFTSIEEKAGIVMSVMVNVQTQVIEAMCNDKVIVLPSLHGLIVEWQDYATSRLKRLLLGIPSAKSVMSEFEDVLGRKTSSTLSKNAYSGWSNSAAIQKKFKKVVVNALHTNKKLSQVAPV